MNHQITHYTHASSITTIRELSAHKEADLEPNLLDLEPQNSVSRQTRIESSLKEMAEGRQSHSAICQKIPKKFKSRSQHNTIISSVFVSTQRKELQYCKKRKVVRKKFPSPTFLIIAPNASTNKESRQQLYHLFYGLKSMALIIRHICT